MIYKLYEKFIELTENYRIWDYLIYIVFIIIILICSLYYVIAHAQGSYVIDNNKLTYTITASKYSGKLALPPLGINCDTRGDISLTFKIKVSNFKDKAVLDIQLFDSSNVSSANQLTRLAGTEQVVTYNHQIGKGATKSGSNAVAADYPYGIERTINMNGEFNQNMQLQFYDLQATVPDGKCVLNWSIPVHES